MYYGLRGLLQVKSAIMIPNPRYHDDDTATGRGNLLTYLLMIWAGVTLGAATFWAANHFLFKPRGGDVVLNDPTAKPREASPREPLDSEEREAVELFKKVKPSVVNVDIVRVQRDVWTDTPTEYQTATGSGFIWDDTGRIVTNFHVIAPLARRPDLTARVVLADRTAYDAVLVGAAPAYDLAVLQFAPHNRPPREKLRPIDLGTSHDLEVGQKAFAIGNPFGLSLTMTKGIISALDRSIESPARTPIPGVIQIDAAINPGNSGGPLLDKSGRLIGVNTAITSPTPNGGNVGIGFAIPADTVNHVVTQIIQSGRALRPDLGIRLYDQRKLRQARYDTGVMIEQTTPNGPADAAGLLGIRRNPRTGRTEPGDLIIAINDEPIDSIDDYERVLHKLRPGEKARIKIVRKDVEQEVTVTVGGI
jgi:S1-C subfamily serine protease